jgi:hypothetical protein
VSRTAALSGPWSNFQTAERFPSKNHFAVKPRPFQQTDGSEGTDLYIDPARFRSSFAANVPSGIAARMAGAQRPLTVLMWSRARVARHASCQAAASGPASAMRANSLDRVPGLRGAGARERWISLFGRVHARESSVLVLRVESGVAKTALLEYLTGRAAGCRVERAAGIESEMGLQVTTRCRRPGCRRKDVQSCRRRLGAADAADTQSGRRRRAAA